MRILCFLPIILLSFFCSNGQKPYISKEIYKIISINCAVCNEHPEDSLCVISKRNLYSPIQSAYHNCHLFFFKNDADSAYKYALLTTSTITSKSDFERILLANYIKARILSRKHLYGEAIKEFLVLKRSPKLNDEIRIDVYSTLGALYLIENDYNRSLEYLLNCLQSTILIDPFNLKGIYNNTALCYLFLKKKKDAETYFQKSIAISEQLKDTSGLADTYTNIANQFYENYQDALAIKYFKKALSLALLTDDIRLKQNANLNMAVVAENKKNYHSALIYRKEYERQHDTLYNRDNVWNTAEIKNKLDSQKNALKVEMIQQANKLQALQLDKQNQKLFLSSLLAAAFLAFFMFAFYAYKLKNKQNKIISSQKEELVALNHTKDQLFSVVAHDLRSPVQTMRVALNKLRTSLSNNDISQSEQVAGQIESLSNGTYSLLNNLLYWTLSQTGQLHFANEKMNICRLIEQVYFDYTPMATVKNITLKNYVPETIYCCGDMNTVKIVLRNLLDNAIKFSEPFTEIVISGYEEEGKCIISVLDSGKGIEADVMQALHNNNINRINSGKKQSTGIGLWLVKTMTERNGGSLRIERLEKGTKINIHLPQYHHHEQATDTYS